MVWLLRSVGSKLKGVTEAIPRRPAGPDALSPEPPGLRVAGPQVRGARWEVHSPSVGSNGASLLPDASHLRALRWGRSRAVRTGPGSPGRRSPPRSPPGRLRPRSPCPAHLAPALHSPERTALAASPGAGRRRLYRSPAGPRSAGNSAPPPPPLLLLPLPLPLHPRRVRLQLLLLSLRLLPPLRPAAPPPPPPPPSAPAPARRPRQSPGPRPARVSLTSPQPASRAARARPLARLGLAPRLPARRRPLRGGRRARAEAGSADLGAAGAGDPAAVSPAPPAREPFTSGRRDARSGRPALLPSARCPRPEVRPRTRQQRRAGVPAALRLPKPRGRAGRAPGAERAPSPGHRHTHPTHSLPLAFGGELKQLWDSPRSWR